MYDQPAMELGRKRAHEDVVAARAREASGGLQTSANPINEKASPNRARDK